MSDYELLLKYRKDVENLRQKARNMKFSEYDIDRIFEDCFKFLNNANSTNVTYNITTNSKPKLIQRLLAIIKYIFIFIMFTTVVFFVLNHHQPTSSLVMRNVQNFIYPGLKMLRILAVPIIKLFPNLSELYDETCLIENPYFQVANMECWPCEHVNSVINSTDSENQSSYQSGIPYTFKSLENSVNLKTIQALYQKNTIIFDKDAQKISSNDRKYTKISDFMNFTDTLGKETHISWRINRMAPARIMRTVFSRPQSVSPWSGQSTERFLMVDEQKARPYVLPNPECSYVLLTQGSGERTIVLKPSHECSGHCRTISVILKPMYSLWYNWWYWRPISLPSENSTDLSISYISSYC